jgi:hypothetical protein
VHAYLCKMLLSLMKNLYVQKKNLSSAGAEADPTRCLIWIGDLIDTGKSVNYGENLYLRLAESPGMHYPILPFCPWCDMKLHLWKTKFCLSSMHINLLTSIFPSTLLWTYDTKISHNANSVQTMFEIFEKLPKIWYVRKVMFHEHVKVEVQAHNNILRGKEKSCAWTAVF